MKLVLGKEVIETLKTIARNSNIEVCGLLLGTREGETYRVLEVREIENRLKRPDAFEMEPLEMVKVLDEAERRGLEVVGIFHSHLNCPPVPSGRDLEGMKNWPVVWLIVTGDEARAWVLRDGLEEVEVRATEGDVH